MPFEDLVDPANSAVAATLGIPGTWTPREPGSPVTLRAVFHRTHRIFDADAGGMIATALSRAWIRLAELPREPLEDDRFAIAGLEFTVAGFEPDGQGGAMLILQRIPVP